MNALVTVETRSARETRRLGEEIGKSLSAGMVITLDGDLGSGKTTFVQGLGTGLGVSGDDAVTSPTYTLIHEYSGRMRLFHIDLYRLEGDPFALDDLGLEEIAGGSGVTVVEWPDRLPAGFFAAYLAVRIDITGEETRKLTIAPVGLKDVDWIQAISKKMKEKIWH